MTRTARIALASTCMAWTGLALAEPSCSFREDAETAASKASKNSVTLLGVDPPEGGELRKNMVLTAEVQFQISDFQPDTYRIVAVFSTVGSGSKSPGDPGNTPTLQHASGRAHLCVPLQAIYDEPTVLWPLSMSVQVLKMSEGGAISVAAYTRDVKFKSPDAPANPKTLPDEYYDALKHTNSFFDNRVVLYKVCIARYPAMQPGLTKAYRAWEARHRADIDLVAELQFERFKESFKGRPDYAASFIDALTATSRENYEGLKPADLKAECDRKLSEFTDPEDTTELIIGDEMAILRKHSGKTVEKGK